MKALEIISGILAIAALLGGLFGTTPDGSPATHQLGVAALMGLFTLGCELERRRDARR